MTTSDRFYRILERLFKEIDQESIIAEVQKLKDSNPGLPRETLAMQLTRAAARRAATVGLAAGTAGGAIGILAMGPDILNLVRQQSRLILSIAFLYDRPPGLKERFREVLATIAASTGTSAARHGVRQLIQRGIEGVVEKKIAKKIAGGFLLRRLPSIAPLIGGIAGGTINYASVMTAGKAAIEYYSRVEPEGPDETPADPSPAKKTRFEALAGGRRKR